MSLRRDQVRLQRLHPSSPQQVCLIAARERCCNHAQPLVRAGIVLHRSQHAYNSALRTCGQQWPCNHGDAQSGGPGRA